MVELLAELLPGEELGPYQVEALAGAGGSSLVYRSIHVPTGEPVAIKIGRSGDDELYRRLRREASLLASVDHPHIVGLRDAGVHGDRPFLVTEWIDGTSLADLLAEEGSLATDDVLEIVAVIAQALDYLHRNGIVHRDLSTTNVLLDNGHRPVLIDLGVGRTEGAATVTADSSIVGTPRYVAPEVIKGDSVGGQADQYSLAVMIHELLTGSSPFPETDNAAAALYQQLDALPEPLSEVDPTIPASVEAAVLRGLAKDPSDRFDRCVDLVAAAVGRASLEHSHTGGGGDATLVGDRSKLAKIVGALGVAVLLTAGAVWFTFGRDGDSSGAAPDEAAAGASATGEAPADADGGDATATDQPAPTTDAATDAPAASDEEPVPETARAAAPGAGIAASLSCNLLPVFDFEAGVIGTDIFPEDQHRTVPGAGADGTAALEVGTPGGYGLYGEAVPTDGARSYGFRAWYSTDGEIADMKMGVTFADGDYTTIEDTELALAPGDEPQLAALIADAPPGTVYAIPWLFKDGSPGVLYADELVFAPVGSCADAEFSVEGP